MSECSSESFQQVLDLCWLHSSIVALFMSDGGKKTLWPRLFKFSRDKGTGKIYPSQLKTFEGKIANFTIILEMVRYVMENLVKKKDYRAKECDISSQDVIYTLFPKIGGESGGYVSNFVDLFEDFTDQIDIDKSSYYNEYFDMSCGAFIVLDRTHAYAYFICNGQWVWYDNEGTGDGKMHKVLKSVEGVPLHQVTELLELTVPHDYESFDKGIYEIYGISFAPDEMSSGISPIDEPQEMVELHGDGEGDDDEPEQFTVYVDSLSEISRRENIKLFMKFRRSYAKFFYSDVDDLPSYDRHYLIKPGLVKTKTKTKKKSKSKLSR